MRVIFPIEDLWQADFIKISQKRSWKEILENIFVVKIQIAILLDCLEML